MVVNRLEDRLALAEQPQMLLQDVQVVAGRVQGGELEAGALGAPVAMIVVAADAGDALRPQDRRNALRQGRLAGGGIADDPQDHRLRASSGSQRRLSCQSCTAWARLRT
jgi:hypothetical protein